MIMALRPVICILCPDCVCVDLMEGVPVSILQSAQNVKVKFLSIIRGVSTAGYNFRFLMYKTGIARMPRQGMEGKICRAPKARGA